MSNEMGNSNITGLQDQDNTEIEAPIKSCEASIASVNAYDIEPERHPVSSPKEKDFHVKDTGLNSEDPSGIGDPHTGKEASDKKDDTEIQAPNGSSEVPLVKNDTNDEETQPIPSSKDDETGSYSQEKSIPSSKDDETGSYSQENSQKRIDQKIQKESSIRREEPNKIEVQVPYEFSKAQFLSNDTTNEPQSVPSTEVINEKVSDSGKATLETSVNQVQEQTSIRRETGNTGVAGLEGFLKAQLLPPPSDLNDEQSPLVPSSEAKSFGSGDTVSEKNPSGTCDQQLENQTLISQEWAGEQMMDLSLDSKSTTGHDAEPMESVDLKSDPQEMVNIHAEIHVEVENRVQGSNGVGTNEPHDSDEEGKKLEKEIDQRAEGSVTPTSDSMVWKDDCDIQMMEKKLEQEIDQRVEGSVAPTSDSVVWKDDCDIQMMKKESQDEKLPDMTNNNGRKLKNEVRIEDGPTNITLLNNDDKEELNLQGKSFTDSQLQVVQLVKSVDSLQVEVSECKEKIQVQDEDSKLIENASETEKNKQNLNPSFVSEGSEENSKVDKMEIVTNELVMIGTNHDENKTNKIELQVPYESSQAQMLFNDKINEPQSVSSSVLNEKVPDSGKDPSEPSVSHFQGRISVRREMGSTDVETTKGFLKAQLVPTSTDLNNEQPPLVPSSEDNSFGVEVFVSETNPLGTSNRQLENQTLINQERSGEQMMDSSLDTKLTTGHGSEPTVRDQEFMEFVDLKSDAQELVNIHAEAHVEVESRVQGSNGVGKTEPYDSDEGKKLEHEINQRVEGSVAPRDSVLWKDGCGIQKMEKEPDEDENLPDMSNNNGRKLENKISIGAGPTDTSLLNNDEKEELNLLGKSFTDSQLEVIQSVKSVESLQVEVSECKEKLQVQDEYTKLIKNGSETEQNKQNLNPFLVSERSEEESKVDMMETHTNKLEMIGTNHDENREGTEVRGLHISGIETDFKVDAAKATENECQLKFYGSNMKLACQRNVMDLEKITESLVDSSCHPIEFTDTIMGGKSPLYFSLLCDFKEISVDTAGDSGTELKGIVKQDSSQSDPIKPAEISISDYPASEEKSHDVTWDLSLLEMADNRSISTVVSNQENSSCYKVDVPKQACNLTNSTGGHDLHREFPTAESKENSKNGSKQEDLSRKVDTREEPSFDLGILIAESEVPVSQFDKQDSPYNSIQYQTTEAKDRNHSFVSHDLEPKQSVNRLTTDQSNSENLKIHVKVTEASRETRIEDSDQSPLLYQDEAVDRDVFELKSYGNETLASKLGVSAGDSGSKAEFKAMNSSKDECSPEKPQDQQKFSAEKQVISLERSDSEKLKMPLLSFMKEKSNIMGSQQIQEKPIGKMAVEDKRNSATEIMDTSPPGREKRKIKSSFFSNCMCCTAVIQ